MSVFVITIVKQKQLNENHYVYKAKLRVRREYETKKILDKQRGQIKLQYKYYFVINLCSCKTVSMDKRRNPDYR